MASVFVAAEVPQEGNSAMKKGWLVYEAIRERLRCDNDFRNALAQVAQVLDKIQKMMV
jgi:hypothetical protein